MQCGNSCLTMNSCTPMSMVWSSCVPMVSFVVFIRGYSHTLRTTLKSMQQFDCFITSQPLIIHRVLLATIHNFGSCPCTRCLILKEKIPDIGKVYDSRQRQVKRRINDSDLASKILKARKKIHENGKAVKSKAVENILASESLVPTVVSAVSTFLNPPELYDSSTQNAFSSLVQFGFNIFEALVPDFMHEFELGVWKALFIHLIRIMVSVGAVQELNRRYREIPTFGRSTIRKFSNNASSMKKLAARNYEDLLQVSL